LLFWKLPPSRARRRKKKRFYRQFKRGGRKRAPEHNVTSPGPRHLSVYSRCLPLEPERGEKGGKGKSALAQPGEGGKEKKRSAMSTSGRIGRGAYSTGKREKEKDTFPCFAGRRGEKGGERRPENERHQFWGGEREKKKKSL